MDDTSPPTMTPESPHDREHWQAYWTDHGQPWRTEPEISTERQAELQTYNKITPNVIKGIYPFAKIKLTRADIEWLLANHEQGRGPVDYHDSNQRNRVGLDLRGADLSHTQLQNLPLARTIGDASWHIWDNLTEKQHRMAAIQFQYADLKSTHLEGSRLEYANMENADLRGCHLEDADLGEANLHNAYCENILLDKADLWYAHLTGAFLWHASLRDARLYETHLDQAHLENLVLADESHVGPRLVDTHWEQTNLAVVDWSQIHMLGDEYHARQKVADGKVKDRITRIKEIKDAIRANRQLALALKNQGLSEESARFVYRAQVLQRKQFALEGRKKWGAYLFSLLLELLTGYGYRMWRIIIVYVLLISLFATLYHSFGLSYPPHISWTEALVLSITAFHGRVFTSPFQLTSPQSIVTACEAITGFTIEGVFIAMLTQRFFN